MKDYKDTYNKAFNLGSCYNGDEQAEGMLEIQELVDKAIPMKLKTTGIYDHKTHCPNCNLVIDTFGISYCPLCGQAIDNA